jgi:SAM-dependent methyltransferase
MLFRIDSDLLQLGPDVVHRGGPITVLRERLGLRKGRASTLTSRIHLVFCALAAARVYRPDGYLAVDEIGTLDGWSREGSVAKLLANEFDLGADAIVEQRGRGSEAQLRLRIPAAEIRLGELPDVVQRLFGRDPSMSAPTEDLTPHPIEDRELATAVAGALRTAIPGLVLQLRPAYQGGRSSLVFRGLVHRSTDATPRIPSATAVLIKVPFAIRAGKLVVQSAALDHERRLLAARAGWPGLPYRVEHARVDLRSLGHMLQTQHGIAAHGDLLAMDAVILSLGNPRTIEAEPRVLTSIVDETATPVRRLSPRDIRNVLATAQQLASLLRLLHRERRAHRHVSVDSIVVRYELGIFASVVAPDLAASIQVPNASDNLLFRDLFDLGRVLVHLITGGALSQQRENFQPPEFVGRSLIRRAVVGEGETVARALFSVGRYLLEASTGDSTGDDSDPPTVRLLDHFLDEIEHIDVLQAGRARGVPERRVSLATKSVGAHARVRNREIWERSAADAMAARLVAIAHLVDSTTLRRWCMNYVTNHRWHLRVVARRDAAAGAAPGKPTVESCLEMLRDGFGRSAAAEMWSYLSTAGLDEPVERLVRILRTYATHWTREERLDISHAFGELGCREGRAMSHGLGDELHAIEDRNARRPDAELLVDWIHALRLISPTSRSPIEQRRAAALALVRKATERAAADASTSVAQDYDRLRSWLRAGALMWQLQSRTAAPPEEDILALERTLKARSSPEIAFWHILLARAWAAAAAMRPPTDAASDEPAWDKAMRALLVAAGIASSRKLPFETAAALLASAALTRVGLSTPELRAGFSLQGIDEESVRAQAAECALLASEAYQWLDAEPHHWGALLEAASLLEGSGFAERLIHAFQLVSLARNNRLLYRALHPGPTSDAEDPPTQFVVYPLAPDDDDRRAVRERALLDDLHRAWLSAPGRVPTSDDPGTAVAHGYLAPYAPGLAKLSWLRDLQIELEEGARTPGTAAHLLDHVAAHYGRPPIVRILDFGCGTGEDARQLATRYQVWALDSPLWLASSRPRTSRPDTAGPQFLKMDLVEYARRVSDGDPPEGSPKELDVVLFRGSLCRVSQRALLLAAACKLLRPGGLIVATDWVQTRVTDRITWSRLVGIGRFASLEVEPGYRRLCGQLQLDDFVSWEPRAAANDAEQPELVRWDAPGDARAPAMQAWFSHRLDEVCKLEGERDGQRRSSYERAFLLRLQRDLEAFVGLSGRDGPLGWLLWAARKPVDA